ncbi:peptidoglycan-binding protein [Sphingomonas sp. CJ20]
MIPRPDLGSLAPAQRAQVIYSEAQSELSSRLWKAALGDADRSDNASPLAKAGMNLDSLLEVVNGAARDAGTSAVPGQAQPHAAHATQQQPCNCTCTCACHARSTPSSAMMREDDEAITAPAGIVGAPAAGLADSAVRLGSNARFAGVFAAAEQRSGIPASAIAAIVDAEAAKGRDGSWNVLSRNPRSSAAGLGQFLSGTWQDLAQTKGTWLNTQASAKGWLDTQGKVDPAHRAELLALRYDPEASIVTIADLAKLNLDRLEKSGVRVRTDSETLAKAAYLSHHLGLGDARKFLGGGLDEGRASRLLAAQIGTSAAQQRIASTGDATEAHRKWLLGFINDRIRPGQFAV